jgi:metal-sulfur cluster biosynthetic enzyme
MSDPQNANPTILSASDLPTRHRLSSPSSKPQPGTIFSYPSPAYTDSPFTTSHSSSSSSSSFTTTNDSASDTGDSDTDTNDSTTTPSRDPIDTQEIYDLISTISDPEHPLSLGSLAVVSLPDISIHPTCPPSTTTANINNTSPLQTVTVLITPTITHCSLATVIGLGVRVRLEQSLPPRFRVDVRIKQGKHASGDEVSKQLADKERVAAAMENETLLGVLAKMLDGCR